MTTLSVSTRTCLSAAMEISLTRPLSSVITRYGDIGLLGFLTRSSGFSVVLIDKNNIWHIARHINLRRAIKKTKKISFGNKNPITRYPLVHNRVSSFVCICAVFSCHLSCLRRRLKKAGARFHTLKTKRRASTSQGTCGGARDRLPQTARPETNVQGDKPIRAGYTF